MESASSKSRMFSASTSRKVRPEEKDIVESGISGNIKLIYRSPTEQSLRNDFEDEKK
jgi:hypothetical protein